MRSHKGMKRTLCYLPVISIALLIAAVACEKKSTDTGPDVEELIDQGWTAFEAGDLESAYTYFYDAINADSDDAEARHGMGWVQLMEGDLDAAWVAFDRAQYFELQHFGAEVGMAIVYRDLPDYSLAISSANTVLSSIPAYVFPHMSSVDWKDLRLIIAQCSYRKGEAYFDDAQAEVDILDPDNGLDPADSDTWVVGSVTYATYAEALMMAIEALESDIADI